MCVYAGGVSWWEPVSTGKERGGKEKGGGRGERKQGKKERRKKGGGEISVSTGMGRGWRNG